MSTRKLTTNLKFRPLPPILVAALLCTAQSIATPCSGDENETIPVLIEASISLEWDQTTGVYTADGDASVKHGDKSLSGNKIIANYDPDTIERDLSRILATGAVTYTDNDRVARGAKIDYDIESETYVLDGPEAMIDGPHGIMKAQKKITYDGRDETKVRVVGIGNASYVGGDGRVVEGEHVVAFIDATGRVTLIHSDGNARVVTPKGVIAHANRLDYTAASDRAELFGNVEIMEGENIIRGARAEIDFTKDISRLLSDNSGKRVTGVLNQ